MFCFRISVSQGWKQFQATPQNRILVSLSGSFQNFRRAPPVLFIWESPPRGGGLDNGEFTPQKELLKKQYGLDLSQADYFLDLLSTKCSVNTSDLGPRATSFSALPNFFFSFPLV